MSAPGCIENVLHERRSEITGSINPDELWPLMCAVGLVKPNQYGDFRAKRCRDSQIEFLLEAVEKKGGDAYSDFLRCLEKENEHLGHAFVASLLKGLPFASKTDTTESAILKRKLQRYMPAMMDIDTDALVPFLMQKHLLTSAETETLLNKLLTSREKINTLLSLLETKGPTAHYLFVCCLEEEKEHPTHQQLVHLIRSHYDDDDNDDGDDDDDDSRTRIPRKRKALDLEDIELPVVKVTKRDPDQVKAHGILISQYYYDKVKEIRRLHYLARWTAAEKIVEDCRLSGDKELYVAVMLRNCSGYVTRKMTDAVTNAVEKARKICEEIRNDNGVILRSRCEWMLAKMYRYMNKSADAQKHIENAFYIHLQYNVQPGEDTALSNYCQACILLESVAKSWCSRDADFARKCLKTATDHAILGDYGLYVSHHHIRLAQLCLHSSPHRVGSCTNTNLLKEAGSALRSVDEDVLAPRTSCLFYITKSDLYRNLKRFTEARKYAEMAHEIAQRSNFKTELHSAKKRFQALGIKEQEEYS